MTLGSHKDLDGDLRYTLDMTKSEFESAVDGKVLHHITGSREISGVWEVSFKKHTYKQHRRYLGLDSEKE